MLVLGLTGSIATGKSTVSSILASPPYSLSVIDADKIARQVVEPGTTGYDAIVSHFGPSTPDLLLPQDGRPINRAVLGKRVFGPGKEHDRKTLNAIVHPAVRREMYRQMLWAYLRGSWAVVLDVPLLFESGWDPLCGAILVVAVHDAEIQMQRLMARDEQLSLEDAENRVASQWDVRDKAARCLSRGPKRGHVVWNDGDMLDLGRQLDIVTAILKSASPQWWAWGLLFCPPLVVGSALWNYAVGWWLKRQWENQNHRTRAKS